MDLRWRIEGWWKRVKRQYLSYEDPVSEDRFLLIARLGSNAWSQVCEGAPCSPLVNYSEAYQMLRPSKDMQPRPRLPSSGLFAVLRGIDPEQALIVAQAAVEAGFHMIEVTTNSPDPWQTLTTLARYYGQKAIVGAGTVLNCDQVKRVAACGGRLVVSPNTNLEVIRLSKRLGLLSVPGCFTPSEIFEALDAGADGIKLFPATAVSPAYVESIRAVIPSDTPLYISGGVTETGIASYIKAGANGFGVGSTLRRAGNAKQAVCAQARGFVAAFNGSLSCACPDLKV